MHYTYTVEDIAGLFGIHKGTVRRWLSHGLSAIDTRRPLLVDGRHLIAYLRTRRTQAKCKCRPGEIYCVRCRAPRTPAAGMIDYKPVTETVGNLVALCPECFALMHRRVNLARLEQVRGSLEIAFPQGDPRIRECVEPSVDSDLR